MFKKSGNKLCVTPLLKLPAHQYPYELNDIKGKLRNKHMVSLIQFYLSQDTSSHHKCEKKSICDIKETKKGHNMKEFSAVKMCCSLLEI